MTLSPTITSPITYTLGGAITATNNFTVNPSAGSANGLTVNLGGTLTVTNGTLTLEGAGAGPAYAVLDTKAGSNFAITANAITIAGGAPGRSIT